MRSRESEGIPGELGPRGVTVQLSEAEWKLVGPIVDWLRNPLDMSLPEISDEQPARFRMTQRLAEALGLQLRLFHALHSPQEVLTKKAFEFALESACNNSGFDASLDENATSPGADIVINGESFSVKTEAGRGTSRERVFLTKLMESAWTKHLTDPQQFVEGVQENVVPRVLRPDRTLIWRCYGRLSSSRGQADYELLEIPKTFWEAMRHLRATDFTPLTRAGSTSVPVRIGRDVIYTLSFDGSDQKLQIRNLAVSRCRSHGQWLLQSPRDSRIT